MPHLNEEHPPISPKSFIVNKPFFIQGKAGLIEAETTCVPNSAHKPVLVVCHPHPLYEGSMQNKVVHTLCKAANLAGIDALRFNFRGVGKSEGAYAEAIGEQDDLQSVLDWIKNTGRTAAPILSGFSFGSYIAASVAQRTKPPALILIAPPVGRFDFEPIEVHVPCLIVQGMQDEVVDSQKVYDWVENKLNSNTHLNSNLNPNLYTNLNTITLEKMENASHFFHGKLVELRTIVQTFLVNRLEEHIYDIS